MEYIIKVEVEPYFYTTKEYSDMSLYIYVWKDKVITYNYLSFNKIYVINLK